MSLVWGHVKLFVNDVDVLPKVLAVLASVAGPHGRATEEAEVHPIVAMAHVVPQKLAKWAGQNCATLPAAIRDVRTHLPVPMVRRLDHLNKAASVVRHMVAMGSGFLQGLDEIISVPFSHGAFSGRGDDHGLSAPLQSPLIGAAPGEGDSRGATASTTPLYGQQHGSPFDLARMPMEQGQQHVSHG